MFRKPHLTIADTAEAVTIVAAIPDSNSYSNKALYFSSTHILETEKKKTGDDVSHCGLLGMT
jgi:hypothetical protein